MTPEEYYQLIKNLQEEEFPGTFDDWPESIAAPYTPGSPRYEFFAPSHHFKPRMPLMTEEIVKELRDKDKSLLSVGCGPAYLERLLTSRLGVDPGKITLADISDDHVPEGFTFYQFGMYDNWPEFNSPFDYIIFPESVFDDHVDNHISGWDLVEVRAKTSYDLLVKALSTLKTPGQIKLTPGQSPRTQELVKERLETEFPDVEMSYFGGKSGSEVTHVYKKAI